MSDLSGKHRTGRFDAARDNVIDTFTGLTWTRADSGKPMNWKEALAWAERLETAGHTDWRLPDVKELQSLLDYSHAPLVDGMPAIDPVFESTAVTVEDVQRVADDVGGDIVDLHVASAT